uniref:Ig-like domain-containing protein n=1 Tax=Strigops habroptila TaxID=2489341 RepID=A0A672UPF0_STRHB
QWLKNGLDLQDAAITETLAKGGLSVTNSRLVVTEAEWNSGAIYTCQCGVSVGWWPWSMAPSPYGNHSVGSLWGGGHGQHGLMAPSPYGNHSVRSLWGSGHGQHDLMAPSPSPDESLSEDITVKVTPPLFMDIFKEKAAKLTCRVLNVANVHGLDISWWKDDGTELPTNRSPHVLEANGLFSVVAVANVCTTDWDKGDTFTCRVTHPDMLFPAQATLQKATGEWPPGILGWLSMQESATITCLAKGFNPPDLFIQWLRNGDPIPASDYVTLPPSHLPASKSRLPASYFTYSALTVPGEDWSSGNVFTCLVGHEKIPMQVVQRSVDKASGKPTAVNVSLVLSDVASSCY